MSKYFYITAEVGGEAVKIAFDSTLSATERLSGSLNNFIFEDGREGADNYVNKSDVISAQGVISDLKSNSSGFLPLQPENAEDEVNEDLAFKAQKTLAEEEGTRFYSTKDNKAKLTEIKNQKIPFSVHTYDKVYTNCYFTNLTFGMNGRNGIASANIASYSVSFTAKQVRLGARAFEAVVADEDVGKYYEEKKKSQGAVDSNTVIPLEAEEESKLGAFLRQDTRGAKPWEL